MEDNVSFKKDIQKTLWRNLNEINERFPGWGVLFDGDLNSNYGKRGEYSESKINKKNCIYKKSDDDKSAVGGLHGSSRGANYYLINRETAKILYENYLPFNDVSDHYYNELFRKYNLDIYWAIPPFVHKIKRPSTIRIDGV